MANSELNIIEQCNQKKLINGNKELPNDANKRSRQRWNLLSKAVRSKKYQMLETETVAYHPPQCDLSTFINTYGLMTYEYVTIPHVLNGCAPTHSSQQWILCQWNQRLIKECSTSSVRLYLKLVRNRLTFEELAGFDNSGNIRLWPCEELLAYLFAFGILKNITSGKVVCELGAGMTALAGLVIDALNSPKQIYLTDGNERCVANIQDIVKRNCFNKSNGQVEMSTNVHVQQLRWGVLADYTNLKNSMDIIICADCLFVTKAHCDLLNTIDYLLVLETLDDTFERHNCKSTNSAQNGSLYTSGTVFLLAPKRGDSLEQFVTLVQQDKRFSLNILDRYDELFSSLFEKLQQTSDQNSPDMDYPFLLVMNRCSENNH